jgi:ABC-type sulfate transport system substrate-binding protein
MKSNQAKSDILKKFLHTFSTLSGSDFSVSSSRGRSIKQYRQLVLGIAV